MQPIHYSLIMNTIALLVAGALSWKFGQPLLFVVTILLAQHALARFAPDDSDDLPGGEYDGTGEVGFTPPK